MILLNGSPKVVRWEGMAKPWTNVGLLSAPAGDAFWALFQKRCAKSDPKMICSASDFSKIDLFGLGLLSNCICLPRFCDRHFSCIDTCWWVNSIISFFLLTLNCQIIVRQILLFFGKKNTYTTLLGPTRLLISDIFPSKPDFHLHKWEKNLPTRPY